MRLQNETNLLLDFAIAEVRHHPHIHHPHYIRSSAKKTRHDNDKIESDATASGILTSSADASLVSNTLSPSGITVNAEHNDKDDMTAYPVAAEAAAETSTSPMITTTSTITASPATDSESSTEVISTETKVQYSSLPLPPPSSKSQPSQPVIAAAAAAASNTNTNTNTTTNTTTNTALSWIWQKNATQKIKIQKTNPVVKFVFVVGLEGTGHHLLVDIFKGSPTYRRMKEIPKLIKIWHQLMLMLYSNHKSGFLRLHCADRQPNTTTINELHGNVIQYMRRIAYMVRKYNLQNKKQSSTTNRPLVIPLNAASISIHPMVSYPQGQTPCRSLDYPNLDLFHDVCNEAAAVNGTTPETRRIQCQHLVLHRDIFDVIKSTTLKRRFNKAGILRAHQLYTTLLDVIFAQLTHNPEKTVGCFDFFENPTNEEVWDPVRELFGWNNRKLLNDRYYQWLVDTNSTWSQLPEANRTKEGVYEEYIQSMLHVRPPRPDEEKRKIFANYTYYIPSLLRAHDSVVNLCRQQFQQNKMRR